MKKTITILIFSLLIMSCKKKEIESVVVIPLPTVKASAYQPLTSGSYWIYQRFTVFSADSEIASTSFDSVWIARDTVIQNDTFAVFQAPFQILLYPQFLLRDSSGYLVDQKGAIKFSLYNFTDTLDTLSIAFLHLAYKMADKDSIIEVPAGNYKTYDYRVYIQSWDFPGEVRSMFTFYAKNIGLVKWNFFYSSSFEHPVYWEYRLVRYHIE